MKTLKSAAALFAMLCLMASCNKEEPQACDCSAAKPNKKTLTGRVSLKYKENLKISVFVLPTADHVVVSCNENNLKNLLQGITMRKDSLVSLECYVSERCSSNKSIDAYFVNIISIKQDSLK